jgi:hypothetical protein
MVGRDVLIGSLLGFGHTLATYVMYIASYWAGKPVSPNSGIDPASLEGARPVVASLLSSSLPQHLLVGMGLLLFLLLLYIVLRRHWLAAVSLWLISVTIELLAFAIPGPLTLWIGPIIISTLIVVAIARFGLLTTISFQLFFDLSFHYALTPNFSSWHAQTTFIILPILIALAVYSFYTSLAGQPLVRGGILQD